MSLSRAPDSRAYDSDSRLPRTARSSLCALRLVDSAHALSLSLFRSCRGSGKIAAGVLSKNLYEYGRAKLREVCGHITWRDIFAEGTTILPSHVRYLFK